VEATVAGIYTFEPVLRTLLLLPLAIACASPDPSLPPLDSGAVSEAIEVDEDDILLDCDADEDGFLAIDCGGDDCDDSDPRTHPGAEDPSWIHEIAVDGQADSPSLAIDEAGALHIAFSQGALGYATNPSGSWSTSVVGDPADTGKDPSLVFHGGVPHIAWWRNGADVATYGVRNGDWAIETVDATGSTGKWSHLAIDVDGAAHIVYRRFDDQVARYATNNTGVWTHDTVSDPEHVVEDVALALEVDGSIHIAYHDTEEGDLWYVTGIPGAWTQTLIDAENIAGTTPSIAIDPGGAVHIAYDNESSDDLNYATNASGDWVLEKPDGSFETNGQNPAIAIDPTGAVHIAYGFGTVNNSSLRHITNESGDWVLTSFDQDRDYAGLDPSIAIDPQGGLVIAHGTRDIGGGADLRVVRRLADGLDQDCDGLPDA